MVTVSISDEESKQFVAAIISLTQATTYAPNLMAYASDIYWALELLNRLQTDNNQIDHETRAP